MKTSLNDDDMREALVALTRANRAFAAAYPGDRPDRQPVHSFYGGAHLFGADVARKLGETALANLTEYTPDAATFARAIGLDESLAEAVHARVIEKLRREPVEDYRIDFEDGYGNRPDAEEDGHAVAAATEMAVGLAQGSLPPFVGIRIKTWNEEMRRRSLRTLDLFLTALLAHGERRLPPGFVVTLPKVTVPEQVTALVTALDAIERRLALSAGAVPIELMIEVPQSVFTPRGELAIPGLVAAARGRCRGAHFGIYDYTASLNVTAMHQGPSHPACEFARAAMQAALAGTGITLSDGSTNVMPVGPHRAEPGGPPLSADAIADNRRAVHHAWRTHYDDVRASLRRAYYQGWDLHPAQLPTRYAAVFAFFLEARDQASARLKNFVDKAAQATMVGNVFDDAATGQGLLGFFLRGISCGALTEAEALATGLTLEELRGRSFVKILDARRAGAEAKS